MDFLSKNAGAVALVAIVIAVGGYFFPQVQTAFGEIGTRFNNGLYVGPVSATTWSVTAAGVMTAIASVTTGTATFTGNIIQAGANTLVAVFPGTVIANNIVQASGGYSQTLTTNTTTTVAQWCAGTAILIASSTAAAFTITLPAASSTFASQGAGGCGATVGSWADQIIDNESSYNITLATTTGGNGIRFFMATGTPATGATYPPFIAASSTVRFTGQYVSTSTLNAYMTSYYRPFGNGS